MSTARTARQIKITLPLPDRILHPNGRAHWRKKNAVFQVAKHDAGLMVRFEWSKMFSRNQSWGPPMQRAKVHATFFKKTQYAADTSDWDGALSSLKATLDGFQEVGLIQDDRGFKAFEIDFAVDKADPRCEIVITELL